VLGGLFRMFLPEFAQQSVPSPTVLMTLQTLLLAIGAYLTYKGFERSRI